MTSAKALGGYDVKAACKLTGCTIHKLRYWDEIALVRPSVQGTNGHAGRARVYAFKDLVALRTVQSLKNEGLSLQRIRRMLEFLRKRRGVELTAIEAVGRTVLVQTKNGLEDALKWGQLVVFEKFAETLREFPPTFSEQAVLDVQREFLDTIDAAKAAM